jgi:ribonucleoside-diphosphate reductase alpha chain
MFIDDSACNLSSVNLMKFRREDGELDIERFRHAVDILITAMEIIVDNSSYPTPAIARNSHDFRALGLGYANLGALLMARGLPYDSNEGRAYTAAVTALMGGEAYRQSALIAEAVGTFPAFEQNREPMLNVIQKHWLHIERIGDHYVPGELLTAAREAWNSAYTLGKEHGFRNAQTTLLAPTGTIGFMMDCDTTGIEPDIAIVKYKKLVGGGMMKIANGTIPLALRRLGYNDDEIGQILGYIDKNDTIEGAPGLRETDLPVFDCAFKPVNGTRSIHYMGHIKMMAASQPFLSGAISKTINLPSEATPDDIMQAYIEAWKLGLKAIAVYRDGSKRTQPVSTSLEEKKPVWKPYRHRLPDERQAITHKFSIAGHEGYITIGMYDDGKPGELFITMSKEGSIISGLMDGFATAVSLALQYGVPLKVLVDKFSHMRFEPSGFTNNERIPIAKSVCDYIFRWLAMKFLPQDEQPTTTTAETTTIAPMLEKIPLESEAVRRIGDAAGTASDLQREREEKRIFRQQADAPPCSECGSIMVRSGSCYKCLNCGATSGCS